MFFASPADKELLWSDAGAVGAARFLDRLWKLLTESPAGSETARAGTPPGASRLNAEESRVNRKLHQTIRKVTLDYEALQFNTGLAALMELQNEVGAARDLGPAYRRELLAKISQLLAPLAPHFAEEAWRRLGHGQSIFRSSWPEADPKWLVEQSVSLAVQVNGKLRGQISVSPDLGQDAVVAKALADQKVARAVGQGVVSKTIFVPGRLLNLVVKDRPRA
jgi:leucyl-tRNA synthetase